MALVKDWIKNDGEGTFQDFTIPLYTTPQRAKVLTDEEIYKLCNEYGHLYAREIRRVLERVRDLGYLPPRPSGGHRDRAGCADRAL